MQEFTLKLYVRAIKNKKRGMVIKDMILLHGNTRWDTAACIKPLVDEFKWDIFDDPSYSPNFAPSNFYLFPKMNSSIASQHFACNEEFMNGVNQ